MAGNVLISFVHPNSREDGEPLNEEEIAGVRIEARVEGSPQWGEIAFVPYPEVSRLFPDMASGVWHFRGTVVGTEEGDNSEPLEASIEIPRAAMGRLQDFSVTLQ